MGQCTSDEIDLHSGVGEGSVVGPLFFISCLADVRVVAKRVVRRLQLRGITVEIETIEYADDVSALIVGDNDRDVQEAVNAMMSEFLLYFSSAGLSMNPDKSEVIMFRSSNATKTMDVKVGEQLESESVKLLGVTVQQNYRFLEMRYVNSRNVNIRRNDMIQIRLYFTLNCSINKTIISP